jgi:hypothetical protein
VCVKRINEREREVEGMEKQCGVTTDDRAGEEKQQRQVK